MEFRGGPNGNSGCEELQKEGKHRST